MKRLSFLLVQQWKTSKPPLRDTSTCFWAAIFVFGGEACAFQPELRYFRTSNRIFPGSLVSRPLVKGNEDPGYEGGIIWWIPQRLNKCSTGKSLQSVDFYSKKGLAKLNIGNLSEHVFCHQGWRGIMECSLFCYSCSKLFIIPLFLLKNFRDSIIPAQTFSLFHFSSQKSTHYSINPRTKFPLFLFHYSSSAPDSLKFKLEL